MILTKHETWHPEGMKKPRKTSATQDYNCYYEQSDHLGMENENFIVVTLLRDILDASPENPVELFADYNYTTAAKL